MSGAVNYQRGGLSHVGEAPIIIRGYAKMQRGFIKPSKIAGVPELY